MFTIVQNYKNMFMAFIRNENGEGAMHTQSNNDKINLKSFDGDFLSDLKALKHAIDDGKIDSTEAAVIGTKFDEIKDEAKTGLQEIMDEMVKNGFSAENDVTYKAYSRLFEKSGIKLPSFDSIKKNMKLLWFNPSNLEGITIKGDKIEIKYDRIGINNTCHLLFDQKTGKFNKFPTGQTSYWSNESLDIDDISITNESKVEKSILNNNISTLEQPEPQPELDKNKLEAARIQMFTELVGKDDTLDIEDGKVFVKHLCPNGETHRALFTINNIENLGINNEKTLKKWKNDSIKSLNDRYPKVEETEEVQPKEVQPKEAQPKVDKNTIIETISETSSKVIDWIEKLLFNDINLNTFKGLNGETFTIEFNKTDKKYYVDTPFFDKVKDYELGLKIPKNLRSKDDVEKYLEDNKTKIKKQYNNKVMEDAILSANTNEGGVNKTILNFTHDGKNVDVELKTEVVGNVIKRYVELDTEFFGDGVDDNQTITPIDGVVNKDKLIDAINKSQAEYKRLYDAYKKSKEQPKKAKEQPKKENKVYGGEIDEML